MQQTNSVLIIGGGLMGLAVAHQLARQGKFVHVLSRDRSEAAGFVAAGMLAPHAEGLTDHLLELGEESLKRIPKWVKCIEEDSGISCGLRFCGIVVPFETLEERNLFPSASKGIPLNSLELKSEVDGISDRWKYGLLFEQDGQIDNRRRLMRALEKACVELGVQFQEGVEVLRLLHERNSFKGVEVRSVEGSVENYFSTEAVLCGGAWSGNLLKELPIFPVKGQMLSLQSPKDALKRVLFDSAGTYLVPREDGLIVVGATSEPDAGFRNGLTPYSQKTLQQGLVNLLPAACHWPPMERWWGFRPCTPDQGPLLGPSRMKGLWLATGHHRNGVLLAAITAEILTSLMLEKSLDSIQLRLINAFRWDRFSVD